MEPLANQVANDIDEGVFYSRSFDHGTVFHQHVVARLLTLGWSFGESPVGFAKPATITYMIKGERSVSLLTTFFMGTFTEIRTQRRGEEFTGLND